MSEIRDAMRADDARHGTYAGANEHWTTGTPLCAHCKTAATRYQKARKVRALRGDVDTLPILGTRRRIQALAHLGYSFAYIGRQIGAPREQVRSWATYAEGSVTKGTAERVSILYERLSMRLPSATTPAEKRGVTLARNLARRKEWLPPLAWDDIDAEEKKVCQFSDEQDGIYVDQIVVDKALAYDFNTVTTKAERHAVIRLWVQRGRSLAELERLSGWNVHRELRGAVA